MGRRAGSLLLKKAGPQSDELVLLANFLKRSALAFHDSLCGLTSTAGVAVGVVALAAVAFSLLVAFLASSHKMIPKTAARTKIAIVASRPVFIAPPILLFLMNSLN